MRHELFPADDLPPGELRSVAIGGIDVVVARTTDDHFYAIRDRCPHAGARLSLGRLEQTVVGNDVGNYSRTGGHVIRCPWHGFEFDVSSGRCIADPQGTRVRAYEVHVENGTVVLERPVRGALQA